MVKVFVKIIGGMKTTQEATVVADVLQEGFSATVNGAAADESQSLSEGDFVVLSKKVKGNGKRTVLMDYKGIVLVQDGAKYILNGEIITKATAIRLASAICDAEQVTINP